MWIPSDLVLTNLTSEPQFAKSLHIENANVQIIKLQVSHTMYCVLVYSNFILAAF